MKALLLLLFAMVSLLSSCAQVNDPQNPMGAGQVAQSAAFAPVGPGDSL